MSNNKFTPLVINGYDNLFKVAIKNFINQDEINLEDIRSRVIDKQRFNILVSALKSPSKMTEEDFEIWCKILGISYTITINRK